MGESERLAELINHLKTNASNFSDHANIAQGSVSNIINGKKRITRDIMDSILAAHPKLNLDWLMRGVGEMFHEPPNEPQNVRNEKTGDYFAIKSPISVQADTLPEEEEMKNTVSDNLRTAAKRWNLTQSEMLELLGGSVGRQGASNYFRGDTLPRLPLLFRLERYCGWPLVVLATRALELEEVPGAPLLSAPVVPVTFSAAETEELVAELHRLEMRIARIIKKIGQNDGGK